MISIKQIPSWGFVLSLAALLEPFVGARYAITGVQTGIDTATGARPLRLNILDLQKDIPSWYVSFSATTGLGSLVKMSAGHYISRRSLPCKRLQKMIFSPGFKFLVGIGTYLEGC
jgi:hypothetical protein